MNMREIKFRGRRIDNGEWVYGDFVHCCPGDCYIGEIGVVEGRNVQFNGEICDPVTVGQFTGLKDKNGVEIYEGDVIKHHGGYSSDELILCRWQEAVTAGDWTIEKPGFRFERINGTGTTIWIADKHFEVIGNVWENADLLRDSATDSTALLSVSGGRKQIFQS